MEVDPRYEFCAPKYYDFGRRSSPGEARRAEAWFDTVETAGMRTPSALHDKTSGLPGSPDSETTAQAPRSRNGEGSAEDDGDEQLGEQDENLGEDADDVEPNENSMQLFPNTEVDEQFSPAQTPANLRSEAQPAAPKGTQQEQRSGGRKRSRRLMENPTSASQPEQLKLTVPHSPKLTTSKRSRKAEALLSTEDIELAKMQEQTERAAKLRKTNSMAVKKILHSSNAGSGPVKSTKPLTQPQAPKFSTAERQHTMGTRSQSKDKGKERRSPSDRCAKKAKTEDDSRAGPLTLTFPKSPKLTAASRHRKTAVKSAAEKEEEEVQEMQKHQFRARPLNRKVLQSCGDLGVPRVTPRETTQASAPNLSTDARAAAHPTASEIAQRRLQEEEEEAKKKKFHARPLNKKVMESCGDLGVPRVTPRPTTNPSAPNLSTDARAAAQAAASRPEPSNGPTTRSASCKSAPRRVSTGAFNLQTEKRGQVKKESLFWKVVEEEEEAIAAKEFVARGLPETTTTTRSMSKQARPALATTQPQEFELRSVALHKHAEQAKTDQLQREEEMDRQRRQFTARGIPTTHIHPMEAKRPQRLLQDVKDPSLNSDKRAQSRAKFDKQMQDKEQQAKQQRARQLEEEAEREAEEIKQMRKQMVPKARPVPKFDRVFQPVLAAKPSSAPITRSKSVTPSQGTRSKSMTARATMMR